MKNKLVCGLMMIGIISMLGCGEQSEKKENTEANQNQEAVVNEEQSEVKDKEEAQTNESEQEDETVEEAEVETEEEKDAEEIKNVPLIPGVYQDREVEQFDDAEQPNEFYYYLMLNEDGTGILDVQDRVDVTWDDKKITYSGNSFEYTFDGKYLYLDQGDFTVKYKYREGITVEDLLDNWDNPEYRFDIEQLSYMLNSFVEEAADKFEFDSYDEVISYLKPGQAYAYIDVKGYDGKVLVITEQTYEYEKGVNAAIDGVVYAMLDGTVEYISIQTSDGTARPLSVKDGVLMDATQHGVNGYFFTEDGTALMCKFSVSELFDGAGGVEYSGFVRETNSFDEDNEVWISTEEEYMACYDEFLAATPIEFTVIQ